MKILNNFSEIEPDEEIKSIIRDKRYIEKQDEKLLVQELRFGENNEGRIRIICNKSPDPTRSNKIMTECVLALYEGYLRSIKNLDNKKAPQNPLDKGN